ASAPAVPQAPTSTSWTVPVPLAENATFSWRARASDGEADGVWSIDEPFSVNAVNDPPTVPLLAAPPEAAVVGVARPDLVVVNASSPDGLALTYGFELYHVEPGGGLTLVEAATGVAAGPTSTSWTPGQDLANAAYSRRARAVDVHQPGPWMASAHFT